MKVLGGKTVPLKMRLTSKGISLLKSLGKLTITVTVTTTGPGRPKTTATKKIHVVYDKPAKHHH
jgi:hypothetical protein